MKEKVEITPKAVIQHDGDVATLKIPDKYILVYINEDEFLITKGGIEYPKTWQPYNAEANVRHGVVVNAKDDIIRNGDRVFFSYMSALDANRIISNGKLYFFIERLWCYLVVRGEEIHMLNGYMLGESIKEKPSELVEAKENDWYVRVLKAGELDGSGVNASVKEGDVVLYRIAKQLKLEGINKMFNREYRVIQRCFCIAKRI